MIKNMTKEEAIELIERIPYTTVLEAAGSKARLDMYKKALSKKDPMQWLKVVKSAYLRTEEPTSATFGTLEREYTRRAKEKLHAALAEALEIKEDEVESFIKEHLKAM